MPFLWKVAVDDYEVQKAKEAGVPRRQYERARDAGATHQEAMEGLNSRKPTTYTWLREHGSNHAEALEVIDRSVPTSPYLAARDAGATHAEIMDAFDKAPSRRDYGGYGVKSDMMNYSHLRWAGLPHYSVNHSEAMDVLSSIPLDEPEPHVRAYGTARGLTSHSELKKLIDQDIPVQAYLNIRSGDARKWTTHEEAMDFLQRLRAKSPTKSSEAIETLANDYQYHRSPYWNNGMPLSHSRVLHEMGLESGWEDF